MATFPRGFLVAVCVLAVVLPGALGQRGTTNVTSANSNGLGDTPVVGQYLDNPGCNAQSGGCIWPSDLAGELPGSERSLHLVELYLHTLSTTYSRSQVGYRAGSYDQSSEMHNCLVVEEVRCCLS